MVISFGFLPFSIYGDGEVAFITYRTGTYQVINNAEFFSDTPGHWAENNITFTSARELFRGLDENIFAPNASMTRAMFVQVLANIYGADLSLYRNTRFDDVSVDAWYAPAIYWASGLGLVGGVGDGRFDPASNITREQMASMLVNYVNHRGYDLPLNTAPLFSDQSDISPWAVDSVRTLQQSGIISGRPGNLFEPQGTATRAEVATVFTQFITARVNYIQ